MAPIRDFLRDLDSAWNPVGGEPHLLQIVGSAALMLQVEYERGTKDGDVLEHDSSPAAMKQLAALGEKGGELHKRHRIYVDLVKRGIMFLPQKAVFHPISGLRLKNFTVEALDPVDVAVSKLKRYNGDDANDIRALVRLGHVDHARLVSRFESARDWIELDTKIEDFPRYLGNLRKVERDILGVEPAGIDPPRGWHSD